MACHTPPLKKQRSRGDAINRPWSHPIPSLNSTFYNGMGPRLGNGILQPMKSWVGPKNKATVMVLNNPST